MKYYKVLMQKEGLKGVNEGEVKDTVRDFGVWCQSVPFDVGMEVKEPVTRDWKDEDGEDSYAGGGLFVAAYDMTVKWVVQEPRSRAVLPRVSSSTWPPWRRSRALMQATSSRLSKGLVR